MTTPSTSTELVIIPGIEANKLALITPESASAVKAAYLPHFTTFLELEKIALNVAVNRPKEARIVRLDLRKVRVAAEKDRLALGNEAKRYKEAVDQVYNLLEDRIAPLEKRLGDIEHAEELAEAARQAALKEARLAELTPFATAAGVDTMFYDLAAMPEGQYAQLLSSTKAAADAKVLAAKQAEEKRIADETARVQREKELAEENRKLAAEAAERQAALNVERAKAEEERRKAAAETARLKKEADDRLAKERAENEAKLAAERAKADIEAKRLRDERAEQESRLRKEREEAERKAAKTQAEKDAAAKVERDRLAAEAEKARLEAKKLADAEAARIAKEAKDKADQAEAARKLAVGPDKDKLLAFAKLVRNLQQVNPKLSTPAGVKLSGTISSQITKFSTWVETEAAKL